MPRPPFFHFPPFDAKTGLLNVVVETPKGCRNKYKYDEDSALFMFDKAFPVGQSFPFDFGFLPSTLGDDGDPLDALLLVDEPSFTGCLVRAKLLGAIEAEQTADGKTHRNDRFIAVPTEVKSQRPPAQSVGRLDPKTVQRIGDFFVAYNHLQGRRFTILRYANSHRAMELIRAGASKAKRQRRRFPSSAGL